MAAYKYEYLPSSNTSPRSNFSDYSGAVDTVMIHHWGIDGQRHDNVVRWLRGANGGQSNKGSSAHYVTSANRVTGLVPESKAAWHCVGRNGSTIGIECRPEMSSGDWKTLVELCADIEERRGSMKYDYHGNNASTACPGRYKKRMGKLVKDINKEHKRRGNDPKDPRRKKSGSTKSSTTGKQSGSKPITRSATSKRSSGYTGPSVVEYLKSIGQDSSYSARARLAQQYGISGYRGTAAQNTALLNKLRSGSSSSSSGGKSIKAMADEVIRGLHGNGHAQRRRSLGVSSSVYKQVRDEVNRRYR